MLGKLQKWVCGSDGFTLVASLETLAHFQNVAYISVISGNDMKVADPVWFMLPFLNVIRMPMSTVSLLAYWDSRNLCMRNILM